MKTVELGRVNRRTRQENESDNLFAWTVFILLMCGFAVACWIGTFYIFTHPEEPFNYQILAKLKRLDPPKRFELTAAPVGEFIAPDKLLTKYGSMTAGQLDEESKNLLRSYLRNYDHQVGKVPYVTGKFTVLDSFPMSPDRFVDSGFAVLAQSVEVPTIFIEHLFPAGAEHVAAMQRTLTTGLGIELRRSYDLSAVVHVQDLGDGKLLFTCIPLLYGPYGTTQTGTGFQLDPPRNLNVKAGLPAISQKEIRQAQQRYAEFRLATGGDTTAAADSKTHPKLVGSEPAPLPSPAPAVAAKGAAKSGPSPLTIAKNGSHESAQPTRSATPAVAAAQPSPPLQPFLTASPAPATTGRVGAWQIYRPGQMPRGRLIGMDETPNLIDKGVGNETIYLRGDFTVTAARDNRAILRARQSLTDRLLNRGNARIIVEYPRGTPTPREGESFQRETERPFQIVDVRKGADGQINVYVREVTTEE
ncbi:MAG: hypothetical protein C5B58_07970 [Acidobacteria bacterium]|nr:MAG: hypothetical protein C5B58_07970 [Acidobacteriota bacterium]